MNNPNNSDNHNNALQSKRKETTHNRHTHTHEKREKFSTHKTTRYITDELEMMEQA